MAMVEAAAISDYERPFCIICYKLEGGSPLVLVAQQVMNKVDNQFNVEYVPLPSVQAILQKTSCMVQEAHSK